ncbi:carbohydrate ABC transporter permease [Thermoanaerobacterium thermosaccharolyticum]|uniref:ABC-type sugar transport system, permease component n=1 Tax=Thermoanaerobacterium thermosaccharolyticum M0795 TaxID=698948 RepID=L0IIY2_THETR|nr:carbohydrate ABC transporter permease [Thermoanaerobacterium thermosaccharolyticum]AGB17937.1 ABC-type sugar transport system, permease component [Thermoanaerobacterium thermosaccharolyticum M0795]
MVRLSEKNSGIIRQFDIKKRNVRVGYYLLILVSCIMVIIALIPIIWIFLSGFKTLNEFVNESTFLPKTYDIKKFVKTWQLLKFGKYYLNSFYSVIGSAIFAVICNGLLAYGISKVRPSGSKLIFTLIMWSLMIPATTSIVPLFVNINKIGLQGTFIPLWLSMGANAFYVVLYKNFFDSIPQSLVEAARLDGCSELDIFFKIILPLSASINTVVVIYAINAAWSDFLLPYLVLNNSGFETVMVRLFQFRTSIATDVDVIRAIVFSIIPPVILFGIFQKYIMEGITQTGIKG